MDIETEEMHVRKDEDKEKEKVKDHDEDEEFGTYKSSTYVKNVLSTLLFLLTYGTFSFLSLSQFS